MIFNMRQMTLQRRNGWCSDKDNISFNKAIGTSLHLLRASNLNQKKRVKGESIFLIRTKLLTTVRNITYESFWHFLSKPRSCIICYHLTWAQIFILESISRHQTRGQSSATTVFSCTYKLLFNRPLQFTFAISGDALQINKLFDILKILSQQSLLCCFSPHIDLRFVN